ncbi:hypothetical protein L484_013097 [Morus notabilis]|uniref:Uncharacterized protein n=1 Tax=Morus notabilis TaxID=981085 RepID=W9R1Q1_9ROSA|nr:hypothetical protein L484_013097 [Morus notabilis]
MEARALANLASTLFNLTSILILGAGVLVLVLVLLLLDVMYNGLSVALCCRDADELTLTEPE